VVTQADFGEIAASIRAAAQVEFGPRAGDPSDGSRRGGLD